MKKYLTLFFAVILGATSCKKDPMPGDMFNKIDGTHIGYQVYFGQAPVLDATDQGYADLFVTFDLEGIVTMTYKSYGGIDPNSGGEAYWPDETFVGDYWRNEDGSWHIQFGNYDTLHVTTNRKFALDWTNGDYSYAEGGGPSTDDRPSFTLTAQNGENTGTSWVLIWYDNIGWLKSRTTEGSVPEGTLYGPPI